MARRWRRTSSVSIVGRLKATPMAKERVLVMLDNLGGVLATSEAARRLHVSPSMFQKLRQTMLEATLRSLEPRPRGRPSGEIPPHVRHLGKLEAQIESLKEELALARIREEIALLFPWTRSGQKKVRRIRGRKPGGTPSGSLVG